MDESLTASINGAALFAEPGGLNLHRVAELPSGC